MHKKNKTLGIFFLLSMSLHVSAVKLPENDPLKQLITQSNNFIIHNTEDNVNTAHVLLMAVIGTTIHNRVLPHYTRDLLEQRGILTEKGLVKSEYQEYLNELYKQETRKKIQQKFAQS